MGMFDEPGDPVPLDEITALRRAVKGSRRGTRGE